MTHTIESSRFTKIVKLSDLIVGDVISAGAMADMRVISWPWAVGLVIGKYENETMICVTLLCTSNTVPIFTLKFNINSTVQFNTQ